MKWALATASLLSACAPAIDTPVLSFDALAAASCADGTTKYDPPPLEISFTPTTLGAPEEIAKQLPPNVTFVTGWHLTSPHADFGGISGLDISSSGEFWAISDKGDFIEFNPDNPDIAGFMPLLDANGKLLSGKSKGDAEGMAITDELVFVSFERDHRILAYNLERCGVAARGVKFSASPEDSLGRPLSANEGAEALDITESGHIRAGYEMVIDGQSPLITFGPDAERVDYVAVEPGFKLVGADEGYLLFRAYDRDRGNRNIVRGPNVEFKIAPPLNVDNFEGLAVQQLDADTTRLYLVSDDNFSNRQRTLLYIFDVKN